MRCSGPRLSWDNAMTGTSSSLASSLSDLDISETSCCRFSTRRGEDISFELENNGSALAQVLGAVYAAERLGPASRHAVAAVLHKAVRWRGPIGPSLVSYLAGVSGARAESLMAFADPVAWALDVLGFEPGTVRPGRKDVMTRFRARLMAIHPDHGGDEAAASKLIGDVSEARRILLG